MVRGGSHLSWFWRQHRGKVIGAVAGVAVALLIMWAGWLWSMLIIALAVLGASIGAWLVDSQADVDIVDE